MTNSCGGPFQLLAIIGNLLMTFHRYLWGKNKVRGRVLRSGTDGDETKNQCFLPHPSADTTQEPLGQDAEQTTTTVVQENLQDVLSHMEGGTSFSTDALRTLYMSLLSGLVEDDSQDMDIDQMIDSAIGSIDINEDGMIDVSEMDHIQLPRQSGDFAFDDVVACTSSNF